MTNHMFTCNSCKKSFPIIQVEKHVKEDHSWK